MIKLGAKDLRKKRTTEHDRLSIKKNPIYIILDNVLDTYNIGSIFRLADAVAAEKVILCEKSETPPHTRIKKASVNTTEWVNWEYFPNSRLAIEDLRFKIKDLRIIAIEQSLKSVPYDKTKYTFPIAFVAGHETDGVSKEVLEIADQIVEIPLFGVNKSLNVMVSLGIVLYEAVKHLNVTSS